MCGESHGSRMKKILLICHMCDDSKFWRVVCVGSTAAKWKKMEWGIDLSSIKWERCSRNIILVWLLMSDLYLGW
jgi:hypothetical protein